LKRILVLVQLLFSSQNLSENSFDLFENLVGMLLECHATRKLGNSDVLTITLEIVFTIAAPAFYILFIGCVLNTKIAYTTA